MFIHTTVVTHFQKFSFFEFVKFVLLLIFLVALPHTFSLAFSSCAIVGNLLMPKVKVNSAVRTKSSKLYP